MLWKLLLFVFQTGCLWVIYWLGNQISAYFELPIPGNVMGMVLLFGLLCSGLVKVEHFAVASGFLLKHISFFFIPIAVGLMNWAALFYQHSLWLTLAIIVSAIAALYAVAFVVEAVSRRKDQWNKSASQS